MNLPNLFGRYLKYKNLSSVTVKNYVADINQFLNWLKQKNQTNLKIDASNIFKQFTPETINQYVADMDTQGIPSSTLNRRLSALRKFGQYGQSQGWLTGNPAQKIKNAQLDINLTEAFKNHLLEQKVSPVTIKNYLSDVRQYLAWMECNQS